jgi:hypothetical protein
VASFLGLVNWIDGVGVRPEATRVTKQPAQAGARSLPATCGAVHFSRQLRARGSAHGRRPNRGGRSIAIGREFQRRRSSGRLVAARR